MARAGGRRSATLAPDRPGIGKGVDRIRLRAHRSTQRANNGARANAAFAHRLPFERPAKAAVAATTALRYIGSPRRA